VVKIEDLNEELLKLKATTTRTVKVMITYIHII
jgi:hypothetical protein